MKCFKEKKDYVSPQLAVLELEVQPLLAGSILDRPDYGNGVGFDQSVISDRPDYGSGFGFDQSDVGGRHNYGSGSNSASSGWSEE